MLKPNCKDIAIVAGYPASKFEIKTANQVKSENYMFADFGHIEA